MQPFVRQIAAEYCERAVSRDTGFKPLLKKLVRPGFVLDTDAEGRVLNSDFKPIKGLYAAGNNAGNRYIVVYQTPMSGLSLGMAMTEGFMLGERLADL